MASNITALPLGTTVLVQEGGFLFCYKPLDHAIIENGVTESPKSFVWDTDSQSWEYSYLDISEAKTL